MQKSLARVLPLILFLVVPMSTHATTMSGGSYTMHGSATAISGAQSSGGTYAEGATADSASGQSSGGGYTVTPVPGTAGTAPASNTPSTQSNQTSTGGRGESGQTAVAPPSITISDIQVVRASPTSITISYTTSMESVGRITYTTPDGATVTLTDSHPQTQHLFIITGLVPSYTYTFILAANQSIQYSTGYQITLSLQSIGEPGKGTTPTPIIVTNPWIGTSSQPGLNEKSTSTTPFLGKRLSPLIRIVLGILLIIAGIVSVWIFRRRTH
ncbi:MAG: hypothetical protein ABIT47_04575 [Candidatus Paceibacterota bacterium]